jgi:hypothetical protein
MRSMKDLLCVAALLGLILAPEAQAAKPNILFIAIDDQNDWIGCLGGHPQIKTPNIDRLAARGTLFTNAHCQAPLCNPSRTSLMTSLRPSTTGIYGLAPWFRTLDKFKDRVALPQYLAEHGYQTYSTGKIYHGGYGRAKNDKEFHELGPAAGVGVKPNQKLVDTPAKHPLVDWGVFPHNDEDKGDWKVASWAVDKLNEKPQEPFFLSVGFFLPHVPAEVQQRRLQREGENPVPHYWSHVHWCFGARDMADFLAKAAAMDLNGHLDRIRVPFLVTHGAGDRQIPLAYAHQTYDQLVNCPQRELKIFTEREGGVEHVGADNMSFAREYIADWFAEQLGGHAG